MLAALLLSLASPYKFQGVLNPSPDQTYVYLIDKMTDFDSDPNVSRSSSEDATSQMTFRLRLQITRTKAKGFTIVGRWVAPGNLDSNTKSPKNRKLANDQGSVILDATYDEYGHLVESKPVESYWAMQPDPLFNVPLPPHPVIPGQTWETKIPAEQLEPDGEQIETENGQILILKSKLTKVAATSKTAVFFIHSELDGDIKKDAWPVEDHYTVHFHQESEFKVDGHGMLIEEKTHTVRTEDKTNTEETRTIRRLDR